MMSCLVRKGRESCRFLSLGEVQEEVCCRLLRSPDARVPVCEGSSLVIHSFIHPSGYPGRASLSPSSQNPARRSDEEFEGTTITYLGAEFRLVTHSDFATPLA